MITKQYGPWVRIRCAPASPPSCDLVVEVREHQLCTPTGPGGHVWREVKRFNDMSDEHAFTNADDLARAERRKLLENEL